MTWLNDITPGRHCLSLSILRSEQTCSLFHILTNIFQNVHGRSADQSSHNSSSDCIVTILLPSQCCNRCCYRGQAQRRSIASILGLASGTTNYTLSTASLFKQVFLLTSSSLVLDGNLQVRNSPSLCILIVLLSH